MNTDADDPRWIDHVTSIAQRAEPAAEAAARRLSFAKAGPRRVLDVGGGSGMFTATLLRTNPEATGTQFISRRSTASRAAFCLALGAGDRFATIDGNYREIELAEAGYDVIVLSNITRMESEAGNQALLGRCRRALAPGGTLIIHDMVIHDGGAGPAAAHLFQVQVLVTTREGAVYQEGDYRAWLLDAGFVRVEFEAVGEATLIFASFASGNHLGTGISH